MRIALLVCFIAFTFSFSQGKSLDDLYRDLQLKVFDFRQKDFVSKRIKPEAVPDPPPAKPGFGSFVRGRNVPIQPVISTAKDPTVIEKPNTVSKILNRIRAKRLW